MPVNGRILCTSEWVCRCMITQTWDKPMMRDPSFLNNSINNLEKDIDGMLTIYTRVTRLGNMQLRQIKE